VRPLHILLAVLVAAIWGFAFVATRIALDVFSAPELAAVRFLIAAAAAAMLPRRPVAWSALIPIGLALFTGQFLFQFFGIARGMPPGLASIAVRTQVFFTVLLSAGERREHLSRRQLAGMALATAGLAAIASTVGDGLTAAGLGLTLVAAVSWGVGNVLLKRLRPVPMLPLMAWLSLVPPLPSLALSCSHS
jgi:O-acetylserine/cysteine efflux transporter